MACNLLFKYFHFHRKFTLVLGETHLFVYQNSFFYLKQKKLEFDRKHKKQRGNTIYIYSLNLTLDVFFIYCH